MKPRFSSRKRGYRTGLAAIVVATLASACGNYVDVRTAVSPEAVMLGNRQTFSVHRARHDTATSPVNDPMIDNSITEQAVANQVRAAFEARGYRYTTKNPDFVVTYQATIAPIMDIYSYGAPANGFYGYRSWYGYSGYYDPYWGGPYGYGNAVATFDRTRVIIDAIDPGSGKLLWRGEGTSGEYSDSKRYVKELGHAVKAVAKKFPPMGTGAAFVAYR